MTYSPAMVYAEECGYSRFMLKDELEIDAK